LYLNYALVVSFDHKLNASLLPNLTCIARGGVRFQEVSNDTEDLKIQKWNSLTHKGSYFNFLQVRLLQTL